MFAFPLDAPFTALRSTLYPKANPIMTITNGMISDTVPNNPALVIPVVNWVTIPGIPVVSSNTLPTPFYQFFIYLIKESLNLSLIDTLFIRT